MEIFAYHHNYPLHPSDFPILQNDKYILRLANNREEIESILRLRFQVFNVELGLGFSNSHTLEMDQDKFDDVCHHLLLICKKTGATIGTYRMQTYSMAAQFLGFDAADIFNLNTIPAHILQSSVEIGRACIAKPYRNSHTFLLLWKGLTNYLLWTKKQYFFGCSSLFTQCHQQAAATFNYFREHNLIHPHILVCPHHEYLIDVHNYSQDFSVALPKIFQAYLTVGAKVCSLPAIDQQFQTIDFLIIANIADFATWKC